MMNIPRVFVALALAIACSGIAKAQTGAGSITLDNGYRGSTSTDSTFEYAETLYIGPGAVWEINGVHIVYSKNVWIAPTAQLSGTGKLRFANPDDNPFYPDMTGATTIDGNNGLFIELNIENANPNNIVLDDIADPGYGTTNPAGALAAALKTGKGFSFETDNGDVILNGHDLVFDENATISNYSQLRMVVTGNSISGHVVKQNSSATTFTFPVGIAEGDYTPAVITGASNYNVSVTNYAATGATINVPQEGMYRTWHIYGGSATSMSLQHNVATNGTLYIDAAAFITQYEGSAQWSSSASSHFVSPGVHTNGTIASLVPATAGDAAWFSKASDAVSPLPITLLYFNVKKQGSTAILDWRTSTEQNNKGFVIERSADGISWNTIDFVNSKAESGNSATDLDYTYTDHAPLKGISYYRLKQTDIDGRYEYSTVRMLRFDDAENVIRVLPNPVSRELRIQGLSGNNKISIVNSAGQVIVSETSNNGTSHTIDVSRLTSGMYFVIIASSNGATVSHKIIKN